MNSIDINNIPTFQEHPTYSVMYALNIWFKERGYHTIISDVERPEIKSYRLTVKGLDWHQYAFRGDTDPVDGLLEPYDEETMIFIKGVA